MPTTLRGPALDRCPHCGEEKRSYAQHWAMSESCRYPRVEATTHERVKGLFAGDGSLEGRASAKLRIETTSRAFAEWIYDALGWLAHGLIQHSPGAEVDAPVYRVTTLAHPDCNRYREWYDDGTIRPPSSVRLTPPFGRALHACDGSLSFGHVDRPHVVFRATDARYREWLKGALADWGLATGDSSDRVRILADDVDEWLASIGDPVPGVEYKWETDRDEYRSE